MFAIPELIPCDRRLFRSTRRGKATARLRVPVPLGASFFVLRVPDRGTFPWQTVQEMAGPLPLLLPDGLKAPGTQKLHLFAPRRFPLLCAVQTAAEILRRRDPRPASLGVLDPYAVLCGRLTCLLPAAGDLRIVTNRPERFQNDIRFAMRVYGAALTVRQDMSALRDCDVIVCENADAAPGAGTVFCVRQNVFRTDTICLSRLVLPPAYEAIRPPDVDALLFASALYELCGVRALEHCRLSAAQSSVPAAHLL